MIDKPTPILPLFLLLSLATAIAADTVLTWPPDGKDAILRFTVDTLHHISSASGQSDYLGEADAETSAQK